ncbi:hypothetical protein IH879_20400, partial [candidate division KSB1 bacterium]|nr:hypothetical protein [candidate division KSB1 bacterium]
MSTIAPTGEFARTVFVIMPFGDGTESDVHTARFETLIKPAVKEADVDLVCVRADDIERTGSVTDRVIEYLTKSKVVIADLFGLNPNVLYELGVRHAVCRGTVLLAPAPDEAHKKLPFDLRNFDVILYRPFMGLERGPVKRLVRRIKDCVTGDPQDSPIGPGMSILDHDVRELDEHIGAIAHGIGQHLSSNVRWA